MHYDIHARARDLVRQSRGVLNIEAAYRELNRRSQEARRRNHPKEKPATITTREMRLPYRDD